MLEIPRSLVRKLRTVFKRLVPRSVRIFPLVVFQGSAGGLDVRLCGSDIAAEFHQEAAYPEETIVAPLNALADCEGRQEAYVTLESLNSGKTRLTWQDADVPQVREYDVESPQKLAPFPQRPGEMTSSDPDLLQALTEASRSAGTQPIRHAVDHVQLRGEAGSVVATDGRQLLLQTGYHFPWTEDLLVPATSVFSNLDVPADTPIALGKTDSHVLIQAGPWTFWLPINRDGHYPQVERVIPDQTGARTRWHLDAEDALFLTRALSRLPGGNDDDSPVTLDLNGSACVRARAAGQERSTEVTLVRSAGADPPVRFALNRRYLARALALGLSDLIAINPDTPLIWQDARRTLVIMPLDKTRALPPAENAVRVLSAEAGCVLQPPPPNLIPPTQRRTTMPAPPSNGNGNDDLVLPSPAKEDTGSPSADSSAVALIAEAEALRNAAHDLFGRTSRLVAALKRQRRQTRLMASTLASLRQLQTLGG